MHDANLLIEFAKQVDDEHRELQRTVELFKIGEKSATNERVRSAIYDCGLRRDCRVQQLKEIADSAPPAIRGRLYAIAIDLAAGKSVYKELCDVAAGIKPAPTKKTAAEFSPADVSLVLMAIEEHGAGIAPKALKTRGRIAMAKAKYYAVLRKIEADGKYRGLKRKKRVS